MFETDYALGFVLSGILAVTFEHQLKIISGCKLAGDFRIPVLSFIGEVRSPCDAQCRVGFDISNTSYADRSCNRFSRLILRRRGEVEL